MLELYHQKFILKAWGIYPCCMLYFYMKQDNIFKYYLSLSLSPSLSLSLSHTHTHTRTHTHLPRKKKKTTNFHAQLKRNRGTSKFNIS